MPGAAGEDLVGNGVGRSAGGFSPGSVPLTRGQPGLRRQALWHVAARGCREPARSGPPRALGAYHESYGAARRCLRGCCVPVSMPPQKMRVAGRAGRDRRGWRPAKAPRKARRFGRAFLGIAAAVRTSGRRAAVAVTFPGAPCCSGVPALFALLCLLRRTIAGAARWGVANAFPFFAGGVRSLSLVEIRCGTRAVPFFRRARETRCLRTRMRFFPLTAFPTPL